MPSDEAELLFNQVNWILAALDLYLDMERNLSDNRYADGPGSEIVYTFDEDIFELFVGGKDQSDPDRDRNLIYTDRRRAVGVFHIKAWRSLRELSRLPRGEESRRADINRQSAVLTTEWLFSGNLPGCRDGQIYISRQHLRELSSRWERLVGLFRSKIHAATAAERRLIESLERDQATIAHENSGSTQPIDQYIDEAPEPLKSDLTELWFAISGAKQSDPSDAAKSFWKFAFSRKLAATLASLEVTEPLSQLLRINGEIASKLRYLHHAMRPDNPDKVPASETFGFWRDLLAKEIERRKSRNPDFLRDPHTIDNDAHTIALVQTLANTAVRANMSKRFVFVTADPVLIDAYRAWHCVDAEPNEPFVLRPVRHFAPLLNVGSMSSDDSTGGGLREKHDIFPLLRQAMEPFLFKLNLRDGNDQRDRHEDSVRWYREQYALKLRLALWEYRSSPSSAERDEKLRAQVADQMIFPTALRDLKDVNDRLAEVIEQGRRIERFAIGFGFRWLDRRLAARKELQEAQRALEGGDEGPLAKYMQRQLTELGSVTLDLRLKFLSISNDLHRAVTRRQRLKTPARKVPLVLALTLDAAGSEESIASEAGRMVERAFQEAQAVGSQDASALDLDLQNPNIRQARGYRLFALYSCIALHLNEWSVAYHCADEAYARASNDADIAPGQLIELEYLYALCIRFRIGAGRIQDAAGADVTYLRYGKAHEILQKRSQSEWKFVDFRAASELSSLIFFACAWSIAEEHASHKSFPAHTIENELGECIDLLDRLFKNRHLCRESYVTDRLSGEEFDQVEEQIAINWAAAFCLARLGSQPQYLHVFPTDYVYAIGNNSEALNWVSALARECLEGRRQCSYTAKLYFKWFEFFRGRSASVEVVDETEHLNLYIDRAISARLRQEFLPKPQE